MGNNDNHFNNSNSNDVSASEAWYGKANVAPETNAIETQIKRSKWVERANTQFIFLPDFCTDV